MTPLAAQVAAGELLSGHRLLERAGEGGFAEVWRAEAPSGGHVMAVKIATTPLGLRLLEAEAEVVRSLHGLPGVLQGGPLILEPRPHRVLRWVGNRTLRDLLPQDGERPRARTRGLVALLEAIRTVAAVHTRGVVHGDLKPENILRSKRGGIFLADFGLSREIRTRRLDSSFVHSMQSRDGLTGGTLAYMAPEMVAGAEPSMAADVYALGVMLHEALLGRRPDKALGPEALRPLLPAGALDVLLRALAFAPEDRYPDACALLADLGGIQSALAATGPGRVLRLAGRNALRGLAAFFVLLRYLSVTALLALYAGIAVACLLQFPRMGLAALGLLLLAAVPFSLLHVAIRWEGPETAEEAARRQARASR